jgi:hypothetical protein
MTIQQYLQSHYINAMRRVAHEIRDLPNVLGFDTLNEPSQGWACRVAPINVNNWPAPMGWSLTAWDAMRLGVGCAISVPYFSSPFHFVRMETLNPKRRCVWRNGPEHCVWYREGIYGTISLSIYICILQP